MKCSVTDFLGSLAGKPFVVQFVTSLIVGDNEEPATQFTSYLIPADTSAEARAAAEAMMESLSDRYRNSEGETVVAKCIGIHSLDEVCYVDDDGRLALGVIQFSQATRPEHLVQDDRVDLPILD